MKRLILAVLMVCVVSPAWGYEKGTVGYLIELHDKNATFKKILIGRVDGMQDGISWANALNGKKGYPKFYCSPPKVILNGAQIFDIFRRYVEGHEKKMSERAGVLGLYVIEALSEAFPCK
jgi:hypothetical protein